MAPFWYLCLVLHQFLETVAVASMPVFVNLQESRVTSAYRKTLNKAWDGLLTWCHVQDRLSPESCSRDPERMNALLIDHIQFLHEERRGVSAGKHALLSIHHRYPHLRPSLQAAWDSVKSWEQLDPVRLRQPIPPLVLDCLFYFAMLMGFGATGQVARDWICFGIGLLCGFDGLLRPCEFCSLKAGLIAVPSQALHSLMSGGLMTVLNGKNRRVFGRVQIAILDRGRSLDWLSWLVRGMDNEVRLFHGGTAKFRRLFHTAVKALHLESLRLSPAGLRAGGATHLFTSGRMDVSRIKYRGRWASLSTLEHYIQEASAQLALMRLDSWTVDRLLKIRAAGSVFESPPERGWQAYFTRPVPQWTSAVSHKQSLKPRL